jgi:hypothetical protein
VIMVEVYAFTAAGPEGKTIKMADPATHPVIDSAADGVSSRRIYRTSLTTWAWLASGVQAPIGKDRRGAKVPDLVLNCLGSLRCGDVTRAGSR